MKKIVYILGNPLIPQDRLPIKLLPKLKKQCPGLNFIIFDPTEELKETNDHLIFIDTVLGLKKVTKFNGLNHWTLSPRISLHDFDLPISLRLMKRLGKIKNVVVIGVPTKGNHQQILEEVKSMLNSI